MGQPSSAFAYQRIAIVNRGEPAMRLINAVREWNAEGRPPLRVIAVYTAPDRRATFVREADEAVLIGPADADDGRFSASPYLDYAELERALRECRADAVWPGWGFVSEKAEFAELCDRLGVTFIGPSAEVMRRLGDKIESKRLAEQVGVPLGAWSGGPVDGLEEARTAASATTCTSTCRPPRIARSRNTVASPAVLPASELARSKASSSWSGELTRRMPRPPPPAVALTISG